jgi:hypothetical protein
MKLPDWLPEIVAIDGAWEVVISILYHIFESDFMVTKRRFQGLPVWWDRKCLEGECYEEGFWHLITKVDGKTGERLFQPRRAERLPWCGPTITNSTHEAVKVWDYMEGKRGRLRTYVWLENLDYVVILERQKTRKGQIAHLVTAFYVEGSSGRRNLGKKYENRES